MNNNKQVFEISLTSLTQNGKACKNVEVTWDKPSCANIKCEFDGKKIKVTIPEDCVTECIYATVTCKDNSCSDCPNTEVIKICPCTENIDCPDCEICVNNKCVTTCLPNQICENDRCVECNDGHPCPCNQICVSGKCKCPPNKPFLNDKGCCVSCLSDNDCPPCTICTPNGCVPIDCQEGVCNPSTGECIECINTGDCNGENECCVNNKCECCDGFIRDPYTGLCVLEPECIQDSDCGNCEYCQNDKCVPVVCPDGFICVNDTCLPICDCSNPLCDRGGACIQLNDSTCYCSQCSGGCSSNGDCGEGCYCQNGNCVPNPCANTPCNNGMDCGENCGCLDGQCVPCDSITCANGCSDILGCRCSSTNACEPDPNPCSNYSCEDNACNEARPDCKCDDNGNCVQVACDGDFKLEKEECSLVATLESNKCCTCPEITLISSFGQPVNQTYDKFEVTIKKGAASNLADALELPTVSDVEDPRINGNEEPLSGTVSIDVEYVFQVTDDEGNVSYDRVYHTNLKNIILDGKGVGTTLNTNPNQIKYPTFTYPQGLLISTRLIFKVYDDIVFPNGCTYKKGRVLYDKTLTKTLSELAQENVNIFNYVRGIGTLSSTDCAKATFYWTKGKHTTNGVVWEDKPFRKIYVDRTGTIYRDFIDKPNDNLAFNQDGSNIDNHGDLWSGYYYRVNTDCGCVTNANYKACGNVGRLVFCNPEYQPNIQFTSCNEIKFLETWRTNCVVNYDQYNDNGVPVPLDGQLEYGIYVNGSTIPIGDSLKTASDNGDIYDLGQIFTWDDVIEYIDLKWSHDMCNECTIRIPNPNFVNKDFVYEIYCSPLGNGGTQYTITVDFNLPINALVQSISLNINNLVITPQNPTVTFVAQPSSNIVASILYSDCTIPFEEIIDLPEDCCEGVDFTFNVVQPNCTTTSSDVSVNTLPTGTSGSFTFIVSGNGVQNTFTNPTLPNNEIGVNVTQAIYGTSPNITATFTPSGGCDIITKTTIVNFNTVGSVTRTQPTTDEISICNSDTTQVIYDIPSGYSGSVNYRVCGLNYTKVLTNGEDLIIDVQGVNGQQCLVEILNNSIIPTNGSNCPAVFDELLTTINFINEPTITFNIPPTVVCKGSNITVNYTSNVAGTLYYTFNGTKNVNIISGSGSFTIPTSTAGNFVFEPTSITYGNCSTNINGSYTANITVNDTDTLTITEATPSSGNGTTCDIALTITSNTTFSITPQPTSNVGGQYIWNSITNGQVITVTTNGLCPITKTYKVNCKCPTIANPTISQNVVQYCSGGTGAFITATPPSGFTIEWNTGATTDTIFVTAGAYTAYSVNPSGCKSTGVTIVVVEASPNQIIGFNTGKGGNNKACELGELTWSAQVNVPNGINSVTITENGNLITNTYSIIGNQIYGNVADCGLSLGTHTITLTLVDNNGCETSVDLDINVVYCCQIIDVQNFEDCVGSASTVTGNANGNVLCAGMSLGDGTPDSWLPPLSNSVTPNTTYGGLAEGMTSSPLGGVFIGAGAWLSGESFYRTLNVVSGTTYKINFWQANAGNGPSAALSSRTQLGDMVNWKVIFDGQVKTSPLIPYEGAGNQTWTSVAMTFTATVSGTIYIYFKNGGTSNPANASRYYAAIDNIVINEGCPSIQ